MPFAQGLALRRPAHALAAARPTSVRSGRALAPTIECRKVAVLGAAGGIGQPLSLLLKMQRLVTHLALYDVAPLAAGVAADLSHCNTNTKVGKGKGGARDRGHGPHTGAAAARRAPLV